MQKTTSRLIFLLMIVVLVNACGKNEQEPVQKKITVEAEADTFKFANLEEIRLYFRANDFSTDTWAAGDRSVPRFYLVSVPSRWRHEVAPNLPPEKKKQYFFFVYTPLVLRSNESIMLDRQKLVGLAAQATRSPEDDSWLRDLASRYFMETDPVEPLPDGLIEELLLRVDVVPPGLALAQAAVESGWSTSRFTDVGNALFGQWTWGADGITPSQQRDNMGDYKIKAFDSPDQSIAAYMRNLNTHRSYRAFRQERARLRAAGKTPDGKTLAKSLTSYSEKGQEYVNTLQSVIKVNHLEQMDKTFLRDMKPVMLVPVGEGSD